MRPTKPARFSCWQPTASSRCPKAPAWTLPPATLEDVDFAVANGNYALEAGITDKLLTTEDKDSEGAKTYANVVAVRAGDEERPEIKALVEALKSDTIRAFIEEKYGANVIPMF